MKLPSISEVFPSNTDSSSFTGQLLSSRWKSQMCFKDGNVHKGIFTCLVLLGMLQLRAGSRWGPAPSPGQPRHGSACTPQAPGRASPTAAALTMSTNTTSTCTSRQRHGHVYETEEQGLSMKTTALSQGRKPSLAKYQRCKQSNLEKALQLKCGPRLTPDT